MMIGIVVSSLMWLQFSRCSRKNPGFSIQESVKFKSCKMQLAMEKSQLDFLHRGHPSTRQSNPAWDEVQSPLAGVDVDPGRWSAVITLAWQPEK